MKSLMENNKIISFYPSSNTTNKFENKIPQPSARQISEMLWINLEWPDLYFLPLQLSVIHILT